MPNLLMMTPLLRRGTTATKKLQSYYFYLPPSSSFFFSSSNINNTTCTTRRSITTNSYPSNNYYHHSSSSSSSLSPSSYHHHNCHSSLLISNNTRMKLSSPRCTYLLLAYYYSLFSTTSSSSLFTSALASSPIKMSTTATTTTTTSKNNMANHVPLATKAMSYFDSSPDPFHAVQSTITLLEQAGFQNINEDDNDNNHPNLIPGGKYYLTKNKSSIIAFAIGKNFDPSNQKDVGSSGGFKIVGAHTDSPNIKIKPFSKRGSCGYRQLAVQCYGGALWHTWFDRDLGISGRVLTRNGDTIEQKLVKIDRPILQIPNVAIHLQTAEERKAFAVNKEDHLNPIIALEVEKALQGTNGEEEKQQEKNGWVEHQESALLELLAEELSVSISDILDFELNLFDVQKAALGGVYSEFIHSGRLDNLASCFMAAQALIDYVNEDGLEDDSDVSMIALLEHEECGSSTASGAGGPIVKDTMERVCDAFCNSNTRSFVPSYQSCINKSFVMSVDQAHAVHPNYASKHEKNHSPKMNQGVVIKRNANHRYATNAITGVIVREVAKKAGMAPLQEFVVRNDSGCGSTIGPILTAGTGIRGIDVGCPMLAMHSIRETMGTADITNGLDLYKAFFKHYREVDDSIKGEH